MFRKMISLILLGVFFIIPATAVPLSFTPPLTGSQDLVAEALGNAGVGDPYSSFLLNPAHATSGKNISLSLPWAGFSAFNPEKTVIALRAHDWNTVAWNLPAGNTEVFSLHAGAGSQFRHFAFDVRGSYRLVSLSSADEDGGALMSELFTNISGSLSISGGGQLIYRGWHDFSWGIGTGISATLWTENTSAVNLSTKGLKEGVMKNVPMYTEASVPVSLGLSYSYRDMISVAGTVRNDRFLLFFRNTFLNHSVAKDMFVNHFMDLFAGSMGINLAEGWTGDLGFSFNYTLGDWKFRVLADIQDISGMISNMNNSLFFIHGGLEVTVNGISLRAGFNRGITAGIGLDMKYMFLDIAVSNVMFPYPGEARTSYLSARMRLGF